MAIDAASSFPFEREEPPWLIVLIASSDGIKTISKIVAALPRGFAAAVIVLQHRATARDALEVAATQR